MQADFAPYEPVGRADGRAPRLRRHGRGHLSLRLQCLEEGCDTSGNRGLAEFETGRVAYRFRTGGNDAFGTLDWPPSRSRAASRRTTSSDIRWRAAETSLPDPSYRADPKQLAALLLVLAALLAGGAFLLARRLWWAPDDSAALVAAEPSATPLQRALALARDASLNGDVPRRRRALERVARELGAVNRPELADEARVLAWSQAGSTEAEVESLAQRAEDGARA